MLHPSLVSSRFFSTFFWKESDDELEMPPEDLQFSKGHFAWYFLGGGFKYFLFSPLPGETVKFD